MGHHRISRIRHQHLVQHLGALDRRIQTDGLGLGCQDDRHTVVELGHQPVGRTGHDGAGTDRRLGYFWPAPRASILPEPGKRERLTRRQRDPHRLLTSPGDGGPL